VKRRSLDVALLKVTGIPWVEGGIYGALLSVSRRARANSACPLDG
jgi:hypothetical protein